MREWMAKIRCIRGMEWVAAAIAVGVIALLLGGAGTSEATEYEKRICRILQTMEGAGEVQVMIHEYETDGERHIGVVVVAEGADSIRVNMELTRAVCTLTGAKETDVEVMAMEKAGRWKK